MLPSPVDDVVPTRQSLLHWLKDLNNQESWREFFHNHWQLVHGLAVKCGLTDAEAQNSVQETMISVARQMPDFKYDPALGTFTTGEEGLRLIAGGIVNYAVDSGDRGSRIYEAPSLDERKDGWWDQDWIRFIATLEEACEKIGWELHA